MAKKIIKNGIFFVTLNELRPVVQGCMVIDGSRIAYIGPEAPLPLEQYDEIIDGERKLYMPGLVNTHGHAAMSYLRGYADDLALQVWLEEKMWPIEGKFTAKDVYWGTSLSVLEMLKFGTTTFVDMYDHMDEVAAVVEQSGMRAVLARGVIGLCPADVQDAKLREAVQFAKDWNGKRTDAYPR